MPIKADLLKYAIVPPYIDSSKMNDEDRDILLALAPKIWHFLHENVGYLYFPVVTIFADETAYRFMMKTIVNLSGQYGKPNSYFDCHAAWDVIAAVLHEDLLADMHLDQAYRIIQEENKDECAYRWAFLDMLILYFTRGGDNFALEIIEGIKEKAKQLKVKGKGILEYLKRFIEDRKTDQILKFLRAVVEHCFTWHHLPGIGSVIKGVADDLMRLHGCYISPELFAYLKETGKFEEVMRIHGMRGNIHLVSDACIFIYPTVIRPNFDAKLVRYGMDTSPANSAIGFHEFMNHTLVHEHAHALHRHGVSKVYFNQKNFDFMIGVKALSEKRWSYNWIEEGFAEETAFLYYYLKVYPGDDTNRIRQFLLRAINEHTDTIREMDTWPYYGRRSIEKKLGVSQKMGFPGNVVYDVPPVVYSGGKKSFHTLISKWKINPESLAMKLDRLV